MSKYSDIQLRYADKRIAFLGASIFQSGRFLQYMRSIMAGDFHAPKLLNCGLGGNRSIMAKYLMEDEIVSLNPDVCFVHFGVNDMGVWLYDAQLAETDELLAERRERNAVYLQGMREIVDELKRCGIAAVLCSPIAVNELLQEDENVETLADNKEKGELIGDAFYQRKTFAQINDALKEYSKQVKQIAEETNCVFCDLFVQTYALMKSKGGLYGKDGIHLTADGQMELGKILLQFLGWETPAVVPKENAAVMKLAELESADRKIQYVKWAMFNPFLGYRTVDLEENVKKEYQESDLPAHKKVAIETYWEMGAQREQVRAEIERLLAQL